jgi:hypothetical protein
MADFELTESELELLKRFRQYGKRGQQDDILNLLGILLWVGPEYREAILAGAKTVRAEYDATLEWFGPCTIEPLFGVIDGGRTDDDKPKP